jgi:hypothetical protein
MYYYYSAIKRKSIGTCYNVNTVDKKIDHWFPRAGEMRILEVITKKYRISSWVKKKNLFFGAGA